MTPPGRVSTIQRWWPVWAWAGVIFGMSSVPGSSLPDVGFTVPDKLVHGGEYAVLGFLLFRARASGSKDLRHAALVGLLTGLGVGILDESYQRLIPGRVSSSADWAADGIGTAIGLLLAAREWRRSRGRGRKSV